MQFAIKYHQLATPLIKIEFTKKDDCGIWLLSPLSYERINSRTSNCCGNQKRAPRKCPHSSHQSRAGTMRFVVRMLSSAANRSSESPWVLVRSADEK
jgi:hypothetical protein